MTHEELEDVIPLYAIGAMERTERQAIEAHLLSGCVPCHTALKEYQSVAVMLPFGLNIAAPPRPLKARMMAARTMAIATEPVDQQAVKPSLEPGDWMNHLFPPETSTRAESLGWMLGVAAVAIIAGGAYLAWTAYHEKISQSTAKLTQLEEQLAISHSKLAAMQQLVNEREQALAQSREELQRHMAETADLKSQLFQRDAEVEDLAAQLAQRGNPAKRTPQDELAALLRAPNVKGVALAGTEMSRQASGMLFYDPRAKKVLFYALNLPPSPAGMTYQLWVVYDSPTPVGTFEVASGETSHLLTRPLPTLANAKKVAVSLEPSGGKPDPTGPLYLLSQPQP